MKTLTTERLILRQFCRNDVDDLYEYAKNPNIGPNAGWKPHENRRESIRIIKRFIDEKEVWAIVDKNTSKVIGSIGLHNDSKRDNKKVKMIGFVLDEPHWGKGLATEAARRVIQYAFEELGLDLVSVYHYPFNKRSKRVIEKCGFRYEGILRLASTIYNGMVYDSVCYSILKEEYMNSYSR